MHVSKKLPLPVRSGQSVDCAKMAELIETLFKELTHVGSKNNVLVGTVILARPCEYD